jgi:serine/threonine-protein kinase
LIYTASGALLAVPFDLGRLETRGAPVPLIPALAGVGDFAIGTDGTLVYADAPGGTVASRSLVWVDRAGKEVPVGAPSRAYSQVRLSPDGTRVAAFSADEERDIWIWDLQQSKMARLTFDPDQDMYPVWTPDGRQIVYGSQREGVRAGVFNLWRQPADGTGAPERLTKSDHTNGPHSFTPDGSLIFEEIVPQMGRDLMRITLDSRRITPLVQSKFQEVDGQVSPNGRWLAYETDVTGRAEIHVRPYPNADTGHWQVSFDGGREPLWARSGKELFYRTSDRGVVRVEVDPSGTTWNPGPPTKLFDGPYFGGGGFWGYDVSPDAQRFLLIKQSNVTATSAPPSIVVVQHWDEELKRLVPAPGR